MSATITALSLNAATKKITISAAEEAGGYIKDIRIDTQRSFVCTNEFSTYASVVEINTAATGVTVNGEGKVTAITSYEIDLSSLVSGAAATFDVDKDMLFIYINAISSTGDPEVIASVIFDQNSLYQLVFKNLNKNITSKKCCSVEQDSVDLVLLFEAFQLSWSTADPRKFIYYWNRLHNYSSNSSSNCGCNG